MPLSEEDKKFITTLPTKQESDEVFIASLPQVDDIPEEWRNKVLMSRITHPLPTAEQEALVEDYIPAMLGAIGVAPVVGPAIGLGVMGRTVFGRVIHGGVTAGLATGAEAYIRPLEEYAGEIHPWLKPLVGLTAGIGSAVTIEALGSEILLKALTKTAPRFWTKQFASMNSQRLISDEFFEENKHILSLMDDGDTEAMQAVLNKLKVHTHDEILSKVNKKLTKMREVKTPDIPPTEKVIKKLSKKNILDDWGYQRLAEVAERDAIHEYQSEFTKLKNQIIDEYWKVEKQFINPKIKRQSVEYIYREEFDRIYRDEILLRTQQKESEYLAKILGVEGIVTKKDAVRIAMEGYSSMKSIENIIKEVTALRHTTQRLANIIRRQTVKEMTAANKAKIQRLRKTYNSKMVNYRAALKIKNDVGLIKKRLSRYLTKGKEIPTEYREQIRNFLSPMFDKPSVRLDETMWRFLTRKYNDEFSIGADILLKKYDDMLKSLPSRTHNFDGLTHTQAKDLDDFAKAFQFVGKQEKVITYKSEKALIELVAKEIHTSALKTPHPRITGTQLEELAKPPRGVIESSTDLISGFLAALKRMEPICRQLDGFQEFGTAWKQVFNKTIIAEVAKEQLGQKVFKRYGEIFQAHRIATKMGGRPTKYWTATSGNLVGYRIDKETAIVMALNSGNKGNMEAMLRGLRVTEKELTGFLKTALNESDWKLVNDIQDTLDDLFPIMAKVYKEMTGLTLQKLKGGRYYPIVADKKYMDFREGFEDLFLEADVGKFLAAVERGFTKTRVGGVKAVKLSLRPLTQHLEDVVHMSTHWKPINEIQRLVKHDLFKQTVKETMGERIYAQFDPWLKNLARPKMTAYPDILVEKNLGKVRRNVTIVALGLVPKVGIKQTLSLITAIPEVGARNTMASYARFMTNPRRFISSISEASPEMMFRQKTWQRELAEMATKYNHRGILKGGAANWWFKFIHLFDRITSSVVWHGAYLKGLEDYTGNANRAVNFANMVVRKTQPASAPKDLPYIMRSGEINRSVTLFYSYYSVYHNQAAEIVSRGLAGNMSVPKVLSTLGFLAMAPTIAMYGASKAWNTLTGRDEEEFNALEFSKAVGVNAISGVPLARDLASATVMGYDYRLSPIEDIGVEAADTGKAIMKLFDEDKEFTKYDFISSAELVGYIFGLPSRQAVTIVLGAQRLLDDETDDLSELLVRPKYQKTP